MISNFTITNHILNIYKALNCLLTVKLLTKVNFTVNFVFINDCYFKV